jgi:putative transposase
LLGLNRSTAYYRPAAETPENLGLMELIDRQFTARPFYGSRRMAATIDWFSRLVVAWRLSNTLDGAFCRAMLDEALGRGTPEVFNTDQGVQFTAQAWTDRLEGAGIRVSMDGRGRAADNVFVERLWRSVKYEDVYLRGYESVPDLERGLAAYFEFYNGERLHQSLGYRTPAVVYGGRGRRAGEE